MSSTVVHRRAPRHPRASGLPAIGRRSRRGFTLIELSVSMLILGSVMVMAVPLVRFVLAERVQADQQQFMLWELENTLDAVSAQPWDKLTAETVAATPIPAAIKARVPEAEWKLQLTEVAAADGVPAARRLNGEVRWKDRRGQWLPAVRLTTWIYAQETK